MSILVLLRHGQTDATQNGLFSGWLDMPLTRAGVEDGRRAGELIYNAGHSPDVIHSSILRRATQTEAAVRSQLGNPQAIRKTSWRLNERHYGSLQGKSKAEIARTFGEDQLRRWRRSFSAAPPPVDDVAWSELSMNPRFDSVPRELLPRSESLAQLLSRLEPYWTESVMPDLVAGRTVLVVAHSNSLRGLVKIVEGISDEAISEVNIPTGIPLVYKLNEESRPVQKVYLDAEAAARGVSAVEREGSLSDELARDDDATPARP